MVGVSTGFKPMQTSGVGGTPKASRKTKKAPPSMQQLIHNALSSLYQVQPLEPPVKRHAVSYDA